MRLAPRVRDCVRRTSDDEAPPTLFATRLYEPFVVKYLVEAIFETDEVELSEEEEGALFPYLNTAVDCFTMPLLVRYNG